MSAIMLTLLANKVIRSHKSEWGIGNGERDLRRDAPEITRERHAHVHGIRIRTNQSSNRILDLWNIVGAESLVDLIYRHFEPLKLLLQCADGTPYSTFVHDVVCMETDLSLKALTAAKAKGLILAELPSEDEMHMICHAYISSLFESVMHDYSKEDMLRYIHTIIAFFSGGAKALLNL